jgi:hypothetical protein
MSERTRVSRKNRNGHIEAFLETAPYPNKWSACAVSFFTVLPLSSKVSKHFRGKALRDKKSEV